MNNDRLDKILDALSSVDEGFQDDKPFFVEVDLPPVYIKIEVYDVGKLTFPLSTETIQKLINISSKAMFGLRDQTILDKNVRNTYEIKPQKILSAVDENALTRMLKVMGSTLGLDENSVLVPHLHNMLIYAPGHFFDLHQDTEKYPNMVATLVVVLPTAHIGGDLTIVLGTKKHLFSTENLNSTIAKCVAFYSDCQHKIDKIRQGYRICLTYNLVLNSPGFVLKNCNQQLRTAISRYFNPETGTSPEKLIYLFNHSYTQHSLRWFMLKGNDSTNASAIVAVAKELNLVPYLVLVEIQETWTASDDDELDPDDMFGREISIDYWIDSNNMKVHFKPLGIFDNEMCWNIETSDFDPYKKESTGHMGNWGPYIDLWYKRAGIVLWPKSKETAMNFQLNYDQAINLSNLTCVPGNEETVKDIIKQAGEYFYKNCYKSEKGNFENYVKIAVYIKDEEMAKSILSHYTWRMLSSNIAQQLFQLQTHYGPKFCIEVLNSWKQPSVFDSSLVKDVDSFISSFIRLEGHPQIAALILNEHISHVVRVQNTSSLRGLHSWTSQRDVNSSLSKRINLVHQTLTAIQQIKNETMLNKVIQHLIANPTYYPDVSLAQLYLTLKDTIEPAFLMNYQQLKNYIVKSMESSMALGKRAEDDWSIKAQISCNCELCVTANQFLGSKNLIQMVWPLAEDKRKHVKSRVHGLDIPITISIEKTGRPYKLIMVKTNALHENDKKRLFDLNFHLKQLKEL